MEKFYWGFATAAIQNEGGYLSDGKSLSNWDAFTMNPNNVADKSNSCVACDMYHRYKEDVALLKECGVNAFRFSINWARVLPDGFNVNDKGIEFYVSLVDELLKNNIEPIVTICHWDMPEVLESQGGWLNRELILESFKILTRVVVTALKGKIKYLITFNEPQNIAFSGYYQGVFAPGKHLTKKETLNVCHHILLAHGYAYRIIKEIDPNIQVSFNNCGWVTMPKDENNELLVNEAYKEFFSVEKERIGDGRTIFYDPIVYGDYPKDYYEVYASFIADIKDGDLDIIHTGLDYVSVNIYNGYSIDFDKNSKVVQVDQNNLEKEDNQFFMCKSMYYTLKYYHQKYHLPIMVSENGFDEEGMDVIHDLRRIDSIKKFIYYLKKAQSEGVNVFAYMVWTFTDNFEWAKGFGPKMGMVAIDRQNGLKRIKKDSFYWYQQFLKDEIK